MRLPTSFILPLLASSIPALAAKSSKSSDPYADALTKSFPVKLTDATYSSLTSAPRDFATVVLLTALDPKFGCAACQDFHPEWDVLARSWQRGDRKGESRVAFAQIDFVDGRNTFQSLGLQHAPVVMLYPPTTGKNAKASATPARFDFSGSTANAEALRAWVVRNVPEGPHPPIVRPFNYLKAIFMSTTILGIITLVTVAAPYAMPIIQNRNVWAAISLLLVLLFTSGHMFNHIRKVPYVAGDGKGGISYFASGFQNQYGMETQVIAAIYGVLSFAAINLALKCPRIVDPKAQQVAVLAWGGAVFFVYSFLLNIFRWKNGGYPFYLPPF